MKKIFLSSLVAAATAMPAFAGVDNINYQAVIKDGGSVVASQKVALKFELLDNAENVVFSEIQYPTTNAAGYVACQLGQDNDLTVVEWGDLTLRVSIDLGRGYEVFSSEAVSSVPSSLYSLRSADTDALKADVDAMMGDVNGQLENLNQVAAVVRANEEAIEELQNNFGNLGENLDMSFGQMTAKFDEVEGQLENLNNVSAVVRANEEAIEVLQADFANLGENLDNSFAQMNAKFEEVDGQLENLNNVSAVVRANEEAIEKVNADFANLGENLDNSFAEMNAKFENVEGQIENLNHVSAVVRVNEESIEALQDEIKDLKVQIEELKAIIAALRGE